MILLDYVQRFDRACEAIVEKRMIALPEGVPADELLRLFKNHERRNVCLANLCDQVEAFERGFKRSKQTKHRVTQIIAGVAQLYCAAVIEHRRQQNLSSAEKSRMQSEGQAQRDVAHLTTEVTGVRRYEGGDAPQ